MFIETPNVRQIKGDPKRRWFTAEGLELIVWLGEKDSIVGFQLCYDTPRKPKALTWDQKKGFLHTGVDDGDDKGWHKPTPVLVPDGQFDKIAIGKRFAEARESLPKETADFVSSKISEYGAK